MKKFLALLLVFATLVSVLAACAESGTEQDDTTVAEESTEPSKLDNIPDDLKFGGEDVVILSRAFLGWTWDEVAVPELNSEPVNDAIYNRNITVGDRLNINIVSSPIEDADQNKPIEEIKRAVLAGSDEYDLMAGACYLMLTTALEGTFRDMSQLEYLDLSQNYWTQDYNEVITYNNRQYTATGMIALSIYRFAFVTMFNKDQFDNKGVPYLYEAVNNGEWTLDYQASLAEDFYQDLNGNSKKDEDDFYGLITSPYISTDPYWASCDLTLVEKNADGEYEYVLDTARLSDVTDKILHLFYESGTLVYPHTGLDAEQDDIRIAFADGNGAMCTTRLVAAEQSDIRNMEEQYGIVPMPKYEKEQAEYGTLQHDQFTVYAIPSTVKEDKLPLLGAVLEVMASESLRTVKPAYYEIALKRKYMSDPIAWEMLDLIFNTIRIDAGIVYTAALGSPHDQLRQIITAKRNTVSSKFKKMDKTVNKNLSKMLKKLDELE
ncbi:MAG: hypothetical protein IJW70_05090 [Clostridia bacterium]|nr:hypothetical protein [Clostridia bacterium]